MELYDVAMDNRYVFTFDLNPLKFDLAAARCLREANRHVGDEKLINCHVSAEESKTSFTLELPVDTTRANSEMRRWIRLYAARFFYRTGAERFPDRCKLTDPHATEDEKVNAWCNLFAIQVAETGGSRRGWRWGGYCPFEGGIVLPFVRLKMLADADGVSDMRCLFPSLSSRVYHVADLCHDRRLEQGLSSDVFGESLLYAKSLISPTAAWLKAAILDGNKAVLKALVEDRKSLFRLMSPRELLCFLCANAKQGIEDVCKEVLEVIADESPECVSEHDLFGWTPLTYTLFRRKNLGYVASARELQMRGFDHRLIELGCDPVEKDLFGVSWRMVASRIYSK